jgi:hypothetical protein
LRENEIYFDYSSKIMKLETNCLKISLKNTHICRLLKKLGKLFQIFVQIWHIPKIDLFLTSWSVLNFFVFRIG